MPLRPPAGAAVFVLMEANPPNLYGRIVKLRVMGKASNRKKDRRKRSERRPIAPMTHDLVFSEKDGMSSVANIPVSGGMASVSNTLSSSSRGIFATSVSVSPVPWREAGEPMLPPPRHAVVRRSVIRLGDPPLESEPSEIEIAQLLALAMERENKEPFVGRKHEVRDHDTDVWLERRGKPSIPVQVTRAQPSDHWELRHDVKYQTSHTMGEAATEILRSIQNKVVRFGATSNLILALDGFVVALDPQTLLRVSVDCQSELEASGFKQIWYVSLHPQQAIRLYPDFFIGDLARRQDEQ